MLFWVTFDLVKMLGVSHAYDFSFFVLFILLYDNGAELYRNKFYWGLLFIVKEMLLVYNILKSSQVLPLGYSKNGAGSYTIGNFIRGFTQISNLSMISTIPRFACI